MNHSNARIQRELRLIVRAQSDPAFRATLLGPDAKAVIAREAGVVFPREIAVRVVEERAGEMVFVLPRRDDATSLVGALSDDDLESVAGGKGGDSVKRDCSGTPGAGQHTVVVTG